MKARIMSFLRPDQRRNWSRDQIYHYRSFLGDFEKIRSVCAAKIDGVEIHALLEKEIRNSYWIYRSSPAEQAVLIAKLCIKRVLETFSSDPGEGNTGGDWNAGGKVKAVFVTSPATGLDSLCKVAASCFEPEEVIFACAEDNSRVRKDVRRRGYDVLRLDGSKPARFRPSGDEARFLRELWRGLRSIDRLNFFQKVFVYLYTRSALRNFLIFKTSFEAQLENGVRHIFTGRPRTPFVNGAIMAARKTAVDAIFVSHTIWYKLPCPVGQLYDLSIFSAAVLQTDECRQEVQRQSPGVKVAVVGLAKPARTGSSGDGNQAGRKIRVGFFLGVNDFLRDVLPRLVDLDIEIYLKTRPPGNNSDQFDFLTEEFDNVKICDHADLPMDKFCNLVDVVVGGYSNAVFQAACMGVPVIGYLTPEERLFNDFLRPVLIPFDISVIKVDDAEGVVSEVGRIAGRREELPGLSKRQLELADASISDLNFLSVGTLLEQ